MESRLYRSTRDTLFFMEEDLSVKMDELTEKWANLDTRMAALVEQRSELKLQITETCISLLALRAASVEFDTQVDGLRSTPPEREINDWIVRGQQAYQEDILKEIVEE